MLLLCNIMSDNSSRQVTMQVCAGWANAPTSSPLAPKTHRRFALTCVNWQPSVSVGISLTRWIWHDRRDLRLHSQRLPLLIDQYCKPPALCTTA